MRIKFNKLSVASGQLGVSLNNGESFTKYEINDQLREDGIPLTAEQQFDQIILRGDSKVLRNLEVLQYFKISNKIFYHCPRNYNYTNHNSDWTNSTLAVSNNLEVNYDMTYDSNTDTVLATPNDAENNFNITAYADPLPSSSIGSILVNDLWLQELFGLETDFDPDKLCYLDENTLNYEVFPAVGYLPNGKPILYNIDIGTPIIYTDDINDLYDAKYFIADSTEENNIVKDVPTISIFINESCYGTKKLITFKASVLNEVISSNQSQFTYYDWDVYKQIGDNSTLLGNIIDCNWNITDFDIESDTVVRITNKQPHTYNYIAHGSGNDDYYSISFDKEGNIEDMETPEKANATFAGWYQDEACTIPLNWGDVDEDSHIYAKWNYLDVNKKFFIDNDGVILFVNITQPSNTLLSKADLAAAFNTKYDGHVRIKENANIGTITFETADDYDVSNFFIVDTCQISFVYENTVFTTKSFPYGTNLTWENDEYPIAIQNVLNTLYTSQPINCWQAYKIDSGIEVDSNKEVTVSLVTLPNGATLTGADDISNKFITDFELGSNITSSTPEIDIANLKNLFGLTVSLNGVAQTGNSLDLSNYKSSSHTITLGISGNFGATAKVFNADQAQSPITIPNIFAPIPASVITDAITNGTDLANTNICNVSIDYHIGTTHIATLAEDLPAMNFSQVPAALTDGAMTIRYIYKLYNYSVMATYPNDSSMDGTISGATVQEDSNTYGYNLVFATPITSDMGIDEWNLSIDSSAFTLSVDNTDPLEFPISSIPFMLYKSSEDAVVLNLSLTLISNDEEIVVKIVDDDYVPPENN